MRKTMFAAGLALVAAAVLIVPLPFVELSPGPAVDVPPRVRIGHSTRTVDGQLLLLTVEVSQPSIAGAVEALVSPHRQLLPRQEVIPPGVDPGRYDRAERAVFAESARAAAAVGLRAAGFPVAVTGGGVQVAEVVPGGPSDGLLRPGDVITSVDGRITRLAGDVTAAAGRAGSPLTLEVKRGRSVLTVAVPLGPVPSSGRLGLGIVIRALNPRFTLPFPVTIDAGDIGGPSAGLMMALSVYDLVGPADLTRGRVVAGTGTIDLAGRVGPIGGIAEKVVAAERAGASVFLAPASEAAAARAAARPGLRVIPVKTFADAVSALHG